ncbi:hypothetical protein DKX38_029637 [Salix brachista]|uniref:BURP domain-containing protein n=1 Tax=Salix brachista TaxID=2182728 RepID=A0A5N5IZT3_9ROSI|nr:hypothetical protein DKX38_029637 [Salix brachista]
MKLLLIFISILLIQAFVGNSFLGNAANSPANMDEESDVVAVDKKHYPKKISKFAVSGPPLAFHSRHSGRSLGNNTAEKIVVIYAQGDAGHRQERKYAIEPAKLAAKDAGVFHQVPMATRMHAHVMQALGPMETSPSALKSHATTSFLECRTFKCLLNVDSTIS